MSHLNMEWNRRPQFEKKHKVYLVLLLAYSSSPATCKVDGKGVFWGPEDVFEVACQKYLINHASRLAMKKTKIGFGWSLGSRKLRFGRNSPLYALSSFKLQAI